MDQRTRATPGTFARGRVGAGASLPLLAALLLAPLAPAAAPPVRPDADPPVPVVLEAEVRTPVAAAALVALGGEARTSAWSALGVLYGGSHDDFKLWGLEGPLSYRAGRIQVGAGTLFLNGFQGLVGAPTLTASLPQLATLRAGDDRSWSGERGCWALRDTDQLRRLPARLLGDVEDGKGIAVGSLEARVYSAVLTVANYTSNAAFERAARTDLAYVHLINYPAKYRGQVVRVEGRLRRVFRFDPPPEAAREGVNDLYEAWISSDNFNSQGYCVLFTEWPARLPRRLLGKEKIEDDVRVAFAGYFFKKYRYKSADGRGRVAASEAPMLIGHSLTVKGLTPIAPAEGAWSGPLAYVVIGAVGGLIFLIVGLTWLLRRSDNRIRDRLLLARATEFVLPPPDATPVAPPVSRPVHPRSNHSFHPRSNHSSDRPGGPSGGIRASRRGDRGGERSSDPTGSPGPEGRGGRSGTGPPGAPEEGAGA
jgi:hypothetical protein